MTEWQPLLPTSQLKVGDRVRIEYEADGVTWQLLG